VTLAANGSLIRQEDINEGSLLNGRDTRRREFDSGNFEGRTGFSKEGRGI